MDIGSRLGAVLFFGFVFSKAKELVGIEKSKFFCQTQEKIIAQMKMQKRVKVLNFIFLILILSRSFVMTLQTKRA